MLNLTVEKREFLPGEELRGTATWDLEKLPKRIEIRLFWYTRGEGDEDDETVDSLSINQLVRQGNQQFSFRLPQEPYSFSGRLITLVWAVELVVAPSGETQRVEVAVSPTGKEILLKAQGGRI